MGIPEESLTHAKGVKASAVACTSFAVSRFGLIGAYNDGYADTRDAAQGVHSSQSWWVLHLKLKGWDFDLEYNVGERHISKPWK